eukprot:TRINITY_DN4258_c0_g1_i1.p2 TRINITY_DN4258_c0_g1~~TRINITY_DN4258_c0_g1_i1.p2  ORF type:complete len:272 (-),score=28.48 TRINITY_DN4258_c0_g1_i1:103-897(-)
MNSTLSVDGFKIPPPKFDDNSSLQSAHKISQLNQSCIRGNPWSGEVPSVQNQRARNIHEATLQKLSRLGCFVVPDNQNQEQFQEFKNSVKEMVQSCHLHSEYCKQKEKIKQCDLNSELVFIHGKENYDSRQQDLFKVTEMFEEIQSKQQNLLNRIHRNHQGEYLSVHPSKQEDIQKLLSNCMTMQKQLYNLLQQIEQSVQYVKTNKQTVKNRSQEILGKFENFQQQIKEHEEREDKKSKLLEQFNQLQIIDYKINNVMEVDDQM